MMVIMQFFAADQYAPRHHVFAGILGLEITITPVVADAVDDACGKQRNPYHLHGPDGNADRAEQQRIHHQHRADADAVVFAVDMSFHPVVGCAVTVVFERFFIRAFDAIQFGAFHQHFFQAENLRAVRVVGQLAFGVMLAVNGGPRFGGHAGGCPQPEAKEMADDGVQIQRAMRGVTVQINRDRGDGDMGQSQRGGYVTPPRQVEQSCVHKSPRLQPVVRAQSTEDYGARIVLFGGGFAVNQVVDLLAHFSLFRRPSGPRQAHRLPAPCAADTGFQCRARETRAKYRNKDRNAG